MHILILAPTPDVASQVQAAVGNAVSHCTVVATWADVLSSLKDKTPDLILADRAALSRLEPTTLLDLTEPDRWPPLMLLDIPANSVRDGIVLAKRLIRTASRPYEIGELRIDTRKKRAGLGERWVTLPPIQYRLLITLAKRAGEVVGYRELLKEVWGYDGTDKEARDLLKVHIRQIRRRLGITAEKHHYIRSVRGFGYMLLSPEEEEEDVL